METSQPVANAAALKEQQTKDQRVVSQDGEGKNTGGREGTELETLLDPFDENLKALQSGRPHNVLTVHQKKSSRTNQKHRSLVSLECEGKKGERSAPSVQPYQG